VRATAAQQRADIRQLKGGVEQLQGKMKKDESLVQQGKERAAGGQANVGSSNDY